MDPAARANLGIVPVQVGFANGSQHRMRFDGTVASGSPYQSLKGKQRHLGVVAGLERLVGQGAGHPAGTNGQDFGQG